MTPIRIYTSAWCGYCQRAKSLLTSLGATFEEIDIGNNPTLAEELKRKYQWSTVPMIFFGDEFMGGYDDIFALDRKGVLREKIFG